MRMFHLKFHVVNDIYSLSAMILSITNATTFLCRLGLFSLIDQGWANDRVEEVDGIKFMAASVGLLRGSQYSQACAHFSCIPKMWDESYLSFWRSCHPPQFTQLWLITGVLMTDIACSSVCPLMWLPEINVPWENLLFILHILSNKTYVEILGI